MAFYTGTTGSDTITGQTGEDNYISGAPGQWAPLPWGGYWFIPDSNAVDTGADNLFGADKNDLIYGFAGNDELYGRGGDDYLYGGDGDDKLYGGDGSNILKGGNGDDLLADYSNLKGDNEFYGEEGDDMIHITSTDLVNLLYTPTFVIDGGAGIDKLSLIYKNYANSYDTANSVYLDFTSSTIRSIEKLEFFSWPNVKVHTFFDVYFMADQVTNGFDKYLDVTIDYNQLSNTNLLFRIFVHIYMGGSTKIDISTWNFTGWDYYSASHNVINIYGDNDKEIIIGSKMLDYIYGKGGDDWLNGFNGSDKIYGGDGRDWILGGDGADTLYGDNGNDAIIGGAGDDLVYGGDGDDWISGVTGSNRMYGGNGNDIIKGGDGNDLLSGDNGNDKIKGLSGNDELYGGDGVDVLLGYDGVDRLYGDLGNDYLYGGRDQDFLYGQDGNDVLRGNRGDDRLYGNSGDDRLYGGGGHDAIKGGAGDDYLLGENGDDQLFGEGGNDRMWGGAGMDNFHYGPSDGTDYVKDFTDGEDKINLQGWGFADAASALLYASQTSWGAVKFDFTNAPGGNPGDILYIENMTLGVDFTAADIIV